MTRNRRMLWKHFVVLATVAALGIVGTCFVLHYSRKRTEFVGKVEKTSGIRCRFTVASNWGHGTIDLPHVLDQSDAEEVMIDWDFFTAPPVNPLAPWLDKYLWHRRTSNPQVIALNTVKAEDMSSSIRMQAGYPEPLLQSQERILTQRHLKIDGYPATLVSSELLVSPKPKLHEYLYVYVPEHSILYTVGGRAKFGNLALMDPEMQAVCSSFHVEKVAAPVAQKEQRKKHAESQTHWAYQVIEEDD